MFRTDDGSDGQSSLSVPPLRHQYPVQPDPSVAMRLASKPPRQATATPSFRTADDTDAWRGPPQHPPPPQNTIAFAPTPQWSLPPYPPPTQDRQYRGPVAEDQWQQPNGASGSAPLSYHTAPPFPHLTPFSIIATPNVCLSAALAPPSFPLPSSVCTRLGRHTSRAWRVVCRREQPLCPPLACSPGLWAPLEGLGCQRAAAPRRPRRQWRCPT